MIAATSAKMRHQPASARPSVALETAPLTVDRLSIRLSIALPKISDCASIAGHARRPAAHSGAISIPDMFIDGFISR